ncbi:MAG TPA: cellulose binding domain-containing protein [Chitinispirillaceae bacterium]|nr:cellulose binding domain-containing protein [Chitinispirillaceae bacterium]
MKKSLFFIILMILVQSSFSQYNLSLGYYEDSGDDKLIRPVLRITNNGSTDINLSGISLDYYIYERDSVTNDVIDISTLRYQVFEFSGSNPAYVSLTFTTVNPPVEGGTKKANIKLHLTFNTSVTLAAGASKQIRVGVNTTDWLVFNESQHYSYISSTTVGTFVPNESIVLRGPDGIISGVEPSDGSGPGDRIAMNWIGSHDAAPSSVLEGDVFFNTTESKTYIYAGGVWNEIGSSFWTKTADGISYTGGIVHTGDMVSNKIQVSSAVVTPKWEIPPPDYVFSKNYSLPDLYKVKQYIDRNHHLEGVPSAEEIQNKGINMAEMNMILLKKIEELTLYTIQLKDELDSQRKLIRSQDNNNR